MVPLVVFPEQRKDDTRREESHIVAQWGLTETTRRPDGGWMIPTPTPTPRSAKRSTLLSRFYSVQRLVVDIESKRQQSDVRW